MARLTDEQRRLASAEELSPADVTERGNRDDYEAAHAAG